MDFAQSALPQDAKIEKAFNSVKARLKEIFGDQANDVIDQPVGKALALAEGFENLNVPMICASLLIFLPSDSDEYRRVKKDFGDDVCDILQKLSSFPAVCEDLAETARRLAESSVVPEVRVTYLANALSAIRALSELLDEDSQAARDPVFQRELSSFTILGHACRESNERLAALFDESLIFLDQQLARGKPSGPANAVAQPIP